jgi:hypothetical protein
MYDGVERAPEKFAQAVNQAWEKYADYRG